MSLALGVGCSSDPAPLAVRAGASITLLLAGEIVHNAQDPPIGFGGEWYGAGYDKQRGSVEFYLEDIDDGTIQIPLLTELVTRVFADPASDAGRDNGGTHVGENKGLGQLMALVTVPTDGGVEEKEYYLRAHLLVPLPNEEEEIFPMTYNKTLEILPPAPEAEWIDEPTPPDVSWGGSGVTDPAVALQLYPHPKQLLILSQPPAAAHLEVDILASAISIQAVIEEQHYGRESIVNWVVDQDRLKIDLFSVESGSRAVAELAIVFATLPGYEYIPPGNHASPGSHFSVDDALTTFWDANGNVISGATATLGPIR